MGSRPLHTSDRYIGESRPYVQTCCLQVYLGAISADQAGFPSLFVSSILSILTVALRSVSPPPVSQGKHTRTLTEAKAESTEADSKSKVF